jgi:Secretion system C-terminal sorting domain
VADSRNSALGGIQKWVNQTSINAWSLAYTLPTGTTAIGAFGVVADFSGLNPKVYATTTESNGNRLIAIHDVGANSTATTLATASTVNTIFKGLVFSPVTSTCVPVSIITTSHNAPICSNQNLILNVSNGGTAPISYTWSGQGLFSSTSIANPSVVNASTGVYTVLASNACGTKSAAVTVTINPTPTIQLNAVTICPSGIATITASGATTYTWHTNSNAPSFTASPVSTTVYTVIGTSMNGCMSGAVTTTIAVVSSPSLTLNTPTICAGKTATIIASGATTYTWSNNQITAIIAVNPTTTTVYTVNADASGCPATVSITATVVVNPLPNLSINFSSNPICIPQRSTELTGQPAGGVLSGSLITGSVFSSSVIGNYFVTYSYTDANTCSNSITETINVSTCLSLNDFSSLSDIRVYPNPADNLLLVELPVSEPTKLSVYDISSRKIMELSTETPLLKLDVSSLRPGIYFIECLSVKGARIKFIKE